MVVGLGNFLVLGLLVMVINLRTMIITIMMKNFVVKVVLVIIGNQKSHLTTD